MKVAMVSLFLFIFVNTWTQDTLTLNDCYRLAFENAPRLNDKEFIRRIGDLKMDNASTNWYPSLQLNGNLSYQSDVVMVALTDPSIPVAFPEVPHDQYGLNVDISQTLYDGGITKQKKYLEQATAAANLQQVEVDLYGLKSKVNHFYFAILILQENRRNIDIHMDNLLKRVEVMESAMEQGILLETELKVLDVEILRVKMSLVEIETRKRSFIEALALLCGNTFQEGVHLEKPSLNLSLKEGESRPEYQWFELKNMSMEAGKKLIEKRRMPVVYAYGQTGYGKPGYNMLSGEWDYYYRIGAGLRWNIWDWNSTSRDRQVIQQQQHMLQNQRKSFDKELRSLMVLEEAKIDQYKQSLKLEEEVVMLQKEISENAATKLANGTITATDYITELNKESLARNNLATHQVLLMQSIAAYLTIQGNM